MSTVSLDPTSSIMGPKHDTRDDMNKTNINTDNELLPGLNIAHHADPEAKGWLSAEFPTEKSESMAPNSMQGKGSAEPDGGAQILIDMFEKAPSGNMPRDIPTKIQKFDSMDFDSPGGGAVPIPMHGDEDLLE